MARIAVLTSGGDSPGMNAAIRAVVRGSLAKGFEVFGVEKGYEGLIDGDIRPMDISSVADIIHRGGTILRTARSKRFMTDEGFERAVSMLRVFKIDGLVVIGGDGSMHGAAKLADAGIPTVTLPATIDNDMNYTDYTIGFNTAVSTALDAIGKIRDTSSAHERTTVIEVMGRKCGDIAIYAGLAGGAESILIPEREPDMAEICQKLLSGKKRGKLHSVIIKAEGVPISAEAFAKEIENRTGQEAKAVVLGYLQRGGSPTATDRIMASRMAVKAVDILAQGGSGAIGIRGDEICCVSYADAFGTGKTTHFEFIDMCDILS